MSSLAAFLLNQQMLLALIPSPQFGKRIVSESSLDGMQEERSGSSKNRAGSGVYYNDHEVDQELHPSQACYRTRYTSVVSRLPAGKPMPHPPFLLTRDFHDISPMAKTQNEAENKKEHEDREAPEGKRHLDRSSLEERPEKRKRSIETKTDQLSGEEKGFIEAALALSGASVFSKDSSRKISPYSTPSLQALPPPPSFLAKNQLDLSSTSSKGDAV